LPLVSFERINPSGTIDSPKGKNNVRQHSNKGTKSGISQIYNSFLITIANIRGDKCKYRQAEEL
jgi:hypothetical protein